MRFGDKIKQMRLQRGWSPEILGLRAGLSRATIYNAEAAKCHWELKRWTIDRLAHAFRATVGQLKADADGIEVSEYLRHRFEQYPDEEAPYGEPPPYSPLPEDAVEDAVITKAAGVPLPGLKGLPGVMAWFKALDREDRLGVFAMIGPYVEDGDAGRKVAKPRETA